MFSICINCFVDLVIENHECVLSAILPLAPSMNLLMDCFVVAKAIDMIVFHIECDINPRRIIFTACVHPVVTYTANTKET